MNNRLVKVAVGFVVLFAIWEWKMASISLWPSHDHPESRSVAQLAVSQRNQELMIDSGRGDFVDRFGMPITGKTIHTLAVFPIAGDRGSQEQLKRLASLLHENVKELALRLSEVKQPTLWADAGKHEPMSLTAEQLEALTNIHLEGIRVVPYRQRYLAPYAAAQTIGFISQHPERVQAEYGHEYATGMMKLDAVIGASGLERSLDRLLRGGKETMVSYYLDAAGEPLRGLDLRVVSPVNRLYPLTIVTTLDLQLQKQIDRYIDLQGLMEGAVVVLDTETGDIVAMASRPSLNPGRIGAEGADEANHAIRAVEPGSIFKLVTEAAALEAGVTSPNETFHCTGEYGKYGLSDWKKGGHGDLTLRQGLAHSCNIVFATIAERLHAKQLADTAFRLGIGRQVGWHSAESIGPIAGPLRLLMEEEPGTLFATAMANDDGGLLAQTGIGQRDVKVSPLQAANMIATIVNEGKGIEPRLVKEVRYANGQRFASFPIKPASETKGRISPATAEELRRGMEDTVAEGTGHSIRGGIWEVAGKSGTAEVVRSGSDRVNQWFIGYGPAKRPRYAIAVLAENRPPNSPNQATQLFRGIMDLAAQHDKETGNH
ncbi:peptidoglycan D,D-transpeptidase FtsI family protein [Paenibacillus curdlanolyticus]|uniref:peptidoglycan D,D-transpeptidase FtsI family protein n=1 Tax=Paenibacillus curdlanolyticus TaxID=59840 RepID=UPI001305307E|nr:penicillin-binding transpeptidase domain-containing protein [Paenibacillus curdlanolyticus]